jgi:ABC-2 type transport system permease protein
VLVLVAPQGMTDIERFAIDQFLMRGGSVVLATSPFDVELTGSLAASKVDSGLAEWLAHLGITIGESMVMDPRNAALPIPMERSVGGMTFREIQMMPYALFPDLRGDSLSRESPVTASLDQLTLNWASPIEVDAGKNQGRTVSRLLESSGESWTSEGLDIIPDFAVDPVLGFAPGEERGRKLLAVAVEGRFDSFYQGKETPRAAPTEGGSTEDGKGTPRSVIERSPESARLVLVASNTFASDIALDLASQGLNTLYTQPIEFLQNAIDWSLEDPGLLSLRGRTQLARTLEPLDEGRQQLWEYLNYGLALGGLVLVWAWRRRVASSDRLRYQRILAEA